VAKGKNGETRIIGQNKNFECSARVITIGHKTTILPREMSRQLIFINETFNNRHREKRAMVMKIPSAYKATRGFGEKPHAKKSPNEVRALTTQ
jgi:hypothetical protein